jgi:hypothetical protein
LGSKEKTLRRLFSFGSFFPVVFRLTKTLLQLFAVVPYSPSVDSEGTLSDVLSANHQKALHSLSGQLGNFPEDFKWGPINFEA